MRLVVLDSGGVTALASASRELNARMRVYRKRGAAPFVVPSVVLIECLHGHSGKDARTNLFLKSCRIIDRIPQSMARRGAQLRTAAGRGSAVDAYVVALAEVLDAAVLTTDPDDLRALAAHSTGVHVEPA